jgi:molecular chaperone DnaJ
VATHAQEPGGRRDYYKVLGVERAADHDEIKRSYRKLALKHHPDRAGDDPKAEDLFKEAAEAYEVLSDPNKRASYDRFGFDGLRGNGHSDVSGMGVNDIFEHFGDIFGDIFGFSSGQPRGGRGRGSRPRRGADLQKELTLTFREAVNGSDQELTLDHPIPCEPCDGSGASPASGRKRCQRCGGAGQVRHSQGFLIVQTTCPDCRGEGSTVEIPCDECSGAGRVSKQRKVKLAVPGGVDEGVQIRVAGEGMPGTFGGPPGDLYVVVRVEPDALFERDGTTIHCGLDIPFHRAALGGEISVPTLDGHHAHTLKPGAQPGDTVRIRGQGAVSLDHGRRGDLVCHLNLNVPQKLTPKQRELIEELARELGDEPGGTRPGFFERLLGED